MLHSMTGFARHAAESEAGVLTCEIKAVNHRYLDLQFRLPEELRVCEPEFRQLVSARIRRGKIECSLHIRRAGNRTAPLRLNRALVEELGARTRELATLLPELGPPDPLELLRWPGVVEEPERDSAPLLEQAHGALEGALTALTAMRQSEGARIREMLASRCEEILAVAGSVRQRMPAVREAARVRQAERLARLDIEAEPGRLEAELALVAQKLDVDEELDRLRSHVSEIRRVMDEGDAVGRRLDFLMQELNREANTLGAKAADAKTSRAAVDLKVLIEQMREQVQNVE